MSKTTKAAARKPVATKSEKPTTKQVSANVAARVAKAKKLAAAPAKKAPTKAQQRQTARVEADIAAMKAADEGFQLARENAVKYLHSRRQAIFALARHFHLDADDLQQEAYEVLLTCLRDYNPLYTKADGTTVSVQFNTFFGNRLEGKALEQRNRDPEYQARQAHLQDMNDEERSEFRKNPPLLVQHLDQETTLQESLRGEVAAAQRSRQTNMALKVAQDSFVEKKLNDLIAAERDDKRRAALMHVKVGGVSSFEEIAYHFGVTDSRASQILNELMDAFYVQRLLDGDLKSVMYDFRKLNLQPKRAQRLLEEAMRHAPSPRAAEVAAMFGSEYPELHDVLNSLPKPSRVTEKTEEEDADAVALVGQAAPAQLTPAEEDQFPLQAMEWRDIETLTALGVTFRPPPMQAPEDMAHIRQISAHPAETWPPLVITPESAVIDGERRIAAARAKGITRLLCQVRTPPSEALAKQLRVCLNSRVRPLDKLELYFAIGALSDLGLTQGVIAQSLGTSRPNVIVYAKVREKASPRLRQLFEDGLIQITNASSAVDLPMQSQDEMADFIRQYGAGWGRGPQFNELYAAAAEGQVAALVPPQSAMGGPQPRSGAVLPLPVVPMPAPVVAPAEGAQLVAPPGSLSPTLATALKKRQESLETALRDSEIWARQREATIASQTSQIHDLRQQVEGYKRELEAQTLLQHGDAATIANYIKEIKAFYAVQERLASAAYQLEKTQTALRSMHLTHRQTVELESVLEKVASLQTALRVQLVKSPSSPPETTR